MKPIEFTRTLLVASAICGLAITQDAHAQVTCPTTSTPTTWESNFLDTNTTKNGTFYNSSGSGHIELARAGENFNVKQSGSPTTIVYAARGDFNNDGWMDFVGSPESTAGAQLTVMRNYTWQNENCTDSTCSAYSGAPPDWNNPTYTVTPKFTAVRTLRTSGLQGRFGIIGADFNGDGWDDVFEAVGLQSDSYQFKSINIYRNLAANDGSGNPTFAAGYAGQSGFTVSNVLGKQQWSGTSIQAYDWNGDKKLDVLIGSDKQSGSIRILLNNCTAVSPVVFNNGVIKCSNNPTFTDGGYLKQNLNANNGGFGSSSGGLPVFAYGDVDGDLIADLVVGAPNCCSQAAYRMRLFKGCSGGTGCTAKVENTASQYLVTNGGTTGVFLADFSLDGKLDFAYTTDNFNYNAGGGGESYYYRNNGTTTPFSAGMTKQLTTGNSPDPTDYDVGLTMDYDHDPNRTPDILVADGNHSGGFYVIANRVSPEYVACGDAASGVIDLGALIDDEMVITAARITPDFTLNGGTITFWMSNEDPANWQEASLCSGSSVDYCVNFQKPVGRSVRWKAVFCSNSNRTQTPVLRSMSALFDYTRAFEHYRGGVIVNDGVVYAGAFQQPGERGRFYAVNAGLNTIYWDAAAKLDATADSARSIYTAASSGAVRLDFTIANAGDLNLQTVLGTSDTQSTSDLITWVRSARFGVGGVVPLAKLGSIETSTPSILTKPGRPNWYSFVNSLERARIDAFINAKSTRLPLVLFGSKDGMIHALHTRPADITNVKNGTEAWAFIPPTVAVGMLQDYTNTTAANAAATDGLNHPQVSSYPDGSPTLVDIHAGNGVFKTVALMAEGNGGKSITALDVTETVDPANENILGPTPMWSATPGDGEAGQAYTKPAVARVLVNNVEKYLAISGTGIDFNDTLGEKGRAVAAYDMTNGALMWKFQAKCPITSDITVFETDDPNDGNGKATLNGFADRVIFADKCGYVYKVDPNVDLAGGWYENVGMGALVANTTPDGKSQYALFSTKATLGALGEDRPIAGTLAARTDNTTRMILFFGTGGIETVAQGSQNAFYAVYADTGEIRSKVLGDCVAGVCEKFYGGTLVTPEQVILTRTIDPAVGTNSCDPGSAKIQALQLNDDALNEFVVDFTLAISSAVMGAMYGDAGAIFFATLSGDIARVGTPRTAIAGGDTATGTGQGMGAGDTPTAGNAQVGMTSPFTLVGWRVIL